MMRRLMITTCAWLLLVGQLSAAVFYVRSTDGSDVDNGTTWALAKATLAGAFTAAAAGDTIYVSDNHAETQATAMTLTSPGTAASPVQVRCGDDAAEPPTALATTGTVSTTGASPISFAGFCYCYGLTFSMGTGTTSGSAAINFISANPWYWRFEKCALINNVNNSSPRMNVGVQSSGGADDELLEMHDTTLQFANVGHTIMVAGQMVWTGSASSMTGATFPTTLFSSPNGNSGYVLVKGVDLSALGSGKNLVSVAGVCYTSYQFVDCKLGASVTTVMGSIAGQGGMNAWFINCDSGDTNYRYEKAVYQGSVYSESTIVRTGGATDGTTPISRKMVSTANSKFYSPLESDPIYAWNETTGSGVTVTVETVTDNVTLTDAEAWVEVEYLGTSGFPLASTASDRAATILTTPTNQTTSSEAWTTTGLTTPVKQKFSVTFTPQEKGMLRVRVLLAKASTTMYFCPKVIDNASGKELMVMSPGYLNEFDAGGAPPSPLLLRMMQEHTTSLDRSLLRPLGVRREKPSEVIYALAP